MKANDDDEEELVDSPHRVNAIIAALRSHNSSTNQSDNVTVMPLSEFPPIASELSEKGTPTEQVFEPTMIFVNTAENAQLLASALRQRNIPCEEFHKLVHHDVKVEGFRKFLEGITSVLVCTDVAARGLDLPFVKHVIQAEFALNVIQHLHRIGRASRAGTLGRATNFVDHHSKELVASILSEQSEESLNHSFSRRRGFRRNLKRKSAREGGADGAKEEVTPS
jgi:superfamily II DNA/RNA helicase